MIYQTICVQAKAMPSKTAIIHNDVTVSYAAFANAVSQTIAHLEPLPFGDGATVVVLINNLLDCWVAVAALQRLGYTTVCVQSSAIIETLELGVIVAVLTTEMESSRHQQEAYFINRKMTTIAQPPYDGNTVTAQYCGKEESDTAGHIIYTSGTTGHYKKLFFPLKNLPQRDQERIDGRNMTADTVCHVINFGLWTSIGCTLAPCLWRLGGTVIVDQRPDWPDHFLRSGLSYASLTPDMASQLLQAVDKLPQPSTPLLDFDARVTAGFMSARLATQITSRLTQNLWGSYGSSEINGYTLASFVPDLDDWHWLAPSHSRVIEVVDEAGDPCAIGEEGIFRIKLASLDCHQYVDNPKATAEAFKDGYFYPGDLAIRRADGRYRILGRSADVLNIAGKKLAAAPIEQKIQQRLAVEQVCLFSGITSSGDDEIVVVLEAEQWPEKTLLDALGVEMIQFDRVRFNILKRFPRTTTGTSKINRKALRLLVYPEE